eukprot:1104099-Rhodomonas_salina.1
MLSATPYPISARLDCCTRCYLSTGHRVGRYATHYGINYGIRYGVSTKGSVGRYLDLGEELRLLGRGQQRRAVMLFLVVPYTLSVPRLA